MPHKLLKMAKHTYLILMVKFLLIKDSIAIDEKQLSILEHSLAEVEGTKCDLALIGRDLTINKGNALHLQRASILISSENTLAEYVSKSMLIVQSNCLILHSGEGVPLNELLYLAGKVQYLKPVGVVYEVKKLGDHSMGSKIWSFPIIFLDNNGGDNIFCPRILQHQIGVSETLHLKTDITRCPIGKELLVGATMPMKYIGGGPFVTRKPGKQPSLGRGSYMAALEVLSQKFGFNTHLMPAKNVAMYIGNVSRRDVEVGVGPIAYDPYFAKSVTYLTWMYTHDFVIFSSRPPEVPALFSLFRPFPPNVWMCIIGARLILLIVKYLLRYFPIVVKYRINHMDIKITRRIIIIMTLFAGFMSKVLYSKSFLSTLVAKDFEQPINTIQDVLASNLTMYYPGKTAIAKYLADDPNIEMRRIMEIQAKSFPFVGGITSSVTDMVLNQSAVVVFSKITGQKPYFHTSKETLLQLLHSMVLPKGSLLESPFNNAISWMQDTGILHKLLDDGYYRAYGRSIEQHINFEKSATTKWTPIANPSMIPAFFGLSLSLLFTILTFFVELLYKAPLKD